MNSRRITSRYAFNRKQATAVKLATGKPDTLTRPTSARKTFPALCLALATHFSLCCLRSSAKDPEATPHTLPAAVATAIDNALHTSERDGTEFGPLYNSRDLTGWKNINCAPNTWQARGDVIYCTGKPIGELRTERMYQNFVLELEWRHLKRKGNAGVFVWADALTARGQPFHRGIEVQVLDGQKGSWFTSDGDIFPIHGATMTPVNGRGGSRAFPTTNRSRPSPQWNHYRIVCHDGAITLSVNGEVVTQGHDCSPRKGYICLESEGSPVEFRHLRIRELADTAVAPKDVALPDRNFVTLYTGIDLTGWQQRPSWQASDWQLTYDGGNPIDSTLWTKESFDNFQLIADWRWHGTYEETKKQPSILATGKVATNEDGSAKLIKVPIAESGIFLRGAEGSRIVFWQHPIGSGGISQSKLNDATTTELENTKFPVKVADQPTGKWNRILITCRSNLVTVVLNNHLIIENAPVSDIPKEGPIGLQANGSPIQFANLFIRRLK